MQIDLLPIFEADFHSIHLVLYKQLPCNFKIQSPPLKLHENMVG